MRKIFFLGLCSYLLSMSGFAIGTMPEEWPVINNVQQLMQARTGTYVLASGGYTISGEVTLPESIELYFSKGTFFQVEAGSKLIVKSRILVGNDEYIWRGTGVVELYPTSMPQVSVWHFGAVPTDKQDDTQAVLKAIQSGFRIATILFPAATLDEMYQISSTIEIFHPSRVANWHVLGEKTADGVALEEKCSRIHYTGKSGPCFNFRGQRLAQMAHLNLVGDNKKPSEILASGRNSTNTWNPENWNTPGLSMDRYNAHAALAFDWGKDGGDGAPWSATCQVKDLVITNFVVAINISPNNGYQGDTYGFDGIKIQHCTWGVSIGQDQARAISFSNMWMDGIFCAYTNNQFGKRNGSAFNVIGGTQQYTNTFKLLQMTTAYRGQSLFAGLFTEAMGLLGTIDGLGINQNATVFTGCEFGTDDNGWFTDNQLQWVTPMQFCNAGTNVNFVGCNFNIRKQMLVFAGGFYQFEGCSFGMTSEVYFNNPLEVSISGRPNFRQEKRVSLQDVIPLHESEKIYVRPTAKWVHLYNSGDKLPQFEIKPLRCIIPLWWQVAFVRLPNTQNKEFELELNAEEARKILPGDYLQTKTKSAFGFAGMDLSFGDMLVPGLRVVSKTGNRLRLQKVSPEVQVNSEIFTGSVYTGFHVFVSGSQQKQHSVGDMIQVDGVVTRVLEGGKLENASLKGNASSISY